MYSTDIIVHFNKKSNSDFCDIVFLYKCPIGKLLFWRISRPEIDVYLVKCWNTYFKVVFALKMTCSANIRRKY